MRFISSFILFAAAVFNSAAFTVELDSIPENALGHFVKCVDFYGNLMTDSVEIRSPKVEMHGFVYEPTAANLVFIEPVENGVITWRVPVILEEPETLRFVYRTDRPVNIGTGKFNSIMIDGQREYSSIFWTQGPEAARDYVRVLIMRNYRTPIGAIWRKYLSPLRTNFWLEN